MSVSGDTATETTDYEAVSDFTITVAAASTSATGTFTLTPEDDKLDEPVEAIGVTGTSAGLTITGAEITITDNDATPSFKVADVSAAEGDAMEFVVTREGAVDNVVLVKWATAADSRDGAKAAGATDYTAVSTAQTINFAKGVPAQTLTVSTIEDNLDEPDETFQVVLSAPAKAADDPGGAPTLADGTAIGTITNDDERPSFAVADASATEGGNVAFVITRTGAVDNVVSVQWKTAASSGASAAASTDYTAVSTAETISFGKSVTKQTVEVATTEDTIDEGDETFEVKLSMPAKAADDPGRVPALGADTAVGTIEDNDSAPKGITLTTDTESLSEAAGETTVTVTATVTGGTAYADDKAVVVSVSGDTATETTDYEAVSDFTITVAAASTSATGTFTLTPEDDKLDEPVEAIGVTGTSAGLTITGAEITITDNDATPSFKVADVSAAEGDAMEFVVTREGAVDNVVLVKWATAADSRDGAKAAGATDYTAVSTAQTINFAKGVPAQTLTVSTIEDNLDEPDETFQVVLSAPAKAADDPGGAPTLADGTAIGTITNDDERPSFAVADASATEGGNVAFVITRTGAVDNVVSVQWKTAASSGASAAASTDYTAVSTAETISFGKSVTKQTVEVATTEDTIDEGDETFEVKLSMPAKAADDPGRVPALGADTAVGTIEDNDSAPKGITLTTDTESLSEAAGETTVTVTAAVTGGTAYADDKAVVVSVSGDTATETADYEAVSEFTITIAAASTSATGSFTLTPVDDNLDEPNETIDVTGTSGMLTVTGAEITINDNDDPPSFSVADGSAAEGAAAEFVVTRGGAVDNVVSVQWKTAADSGDGVKAAGAMDYTAISTARTIGFAKGVTKQTVSVSTTEDTIYEPDETFQVKLSDPAKAEGDPAVTLDLADDTAIGTITNDGDPPSFTLALTPSTIVESGATNASTVTASMDGTSSEAVLLTVSAAAVSPAVSGDYTLSANKTLTIAAGATASTGDVTITAVDNKVDADDKTVTVSATVSGELEWETPASQTLTITDNDTHGVKVSLVALSVKEADNPSTRTKENEGTYTVVLNSQPTATVTVAVSSGAPGVATVAPAALTFAPGAWNVAQTVTVTGVADTIDNTNNLRAVDVTHAVTSSDSQYDGEKAAKVLVTVEDDDDAPDGIILTVDTDGSMDGDQDTVSENAGATTVTVTASVDGTTRYADKKAVEVSVADDTAVSPADYAAVSNFTITIAAGAASATGTFTLTPADDDLDELDEALKVEGELTEIEVTGAAITITDADDTPTVSLSLTPSTIDESGATNVSTVTASLNRASSRAITVTVSAAPGSDTVAGDYTLSTNKTLTIAAGATASTGTVTITAVDNDVDADNKSVTVSGAASGGGVSNPADVTLTIADDEGVPTLSLVLTPSEIDESGSTNASTVTARLSGKSSVAVEVEVSAAAVSPAASGDYTLSANTALTIAAGATASTGTVTITAVDNDVDAANKTVTVSGVASGGGILNPADVTLTITDDDDRGITVSAATLTMAEADNTGTSGTKENEKTYTVVLTSEPTGTVTVSMASGAEGVATVSPSSLEFDAGDWETAQTVTVAGIDDAIDNAMNKRTTSVTHTVSASGTDYQGETASSVSIDVTDDDTRGITVSAESLTMDERDDASTQGMKENEKTYTVVLTSEPTGTVTVGVSSGATTVATVSPSSLEFDAADWDTKQTVTVTAVDDAIDNAMNKRTTRITHMVSAAGTDYQGETASSVSIEVTDDDKAPTELNVVVDTQVDGLPDKVDEDAGDTPVSLTVSISGETRFESAQTIMVTVGKADDAAAEGSGGDYATVADFTITLAAGAASATGSFTLTPIDDDLDEPDEALSVEATLSGTTITNDEVLIVDNDTHGVTVEPVTLELRETDNTSTSDAEENKKTYTVVLTSEPTGTVTVTAASGAEGVATVSPTELTFAPGAWETEQTVTVTAVDDAVDNTMDKRTTEVTHAVTSSDPLYEGEEAAKVAVTVTDDDATPGGITLSANPASVGEEDGATAVTVTATVNGATRYAGATEVVVSVADGTAVSPGDYASVSGFTITIAAGAASASGSFTLTPVDDSLDEDNETINVTGASGTLTVSGTAVTITDDDDTPAVSLSLTPATIGESGATNASTVTASLDGASSWAVTVTVSAAPGPDTASGDYRLSATPMLTIAAGATASTGTVTITAVDNDVDAANKSVTVSGAVSGGGDKISNPTDVTLAITDDDTRGITVSPPTLTVDEQDDGGTPATENEGTYTVVLTSEPTGTVTVSAASGAEGVATVSPSSLEFDAGDWETKQTVTVTGIDDAVDNTMNKRTTRITHTVSASGTDYQGETASSVSVEVTDDDVTPGGITLSANPASVGEEDGATAVTVTATVNGATRYAGATEVVVSVADGTAVSPGDYASVSGFTITIAAGAASASGSFTLTPVDDSLDEDNETINVTGASGTLTVSGTAVTITDDDDTPAVSLSLTPATIGESGATNASTVTASLDGASSWAVTVTVSAAPGPDTASGDYRLSATPMLTIAAGATASTGTVTITAVDNDVDAANKSVTVSGAVSGGGDKISNPTDVTLAITDDDTRGITVSPPTLTVDEQDDGSTPGTTENEATYTVVLTSEPTGTVTVSAASGAEGVATVSPSSLEFDAGDWETKQTVTVTGIDDAVDNTMDKRTTEVTHAVTSSDPLYEGEEAAKVAVTVTDDDATPGGITLSANPASVGEEDGATAVTVTATVNGATRYAGATEVVVSVADGTAVSPGDYASVSGFTITIAAGAASASGSFTLTPVDDSLDEDNETINVTGASGTLTVSGTAVTITDDDDTPAVSLSLTPATIGESGATNASTVTASLDGASSWAVTVTVSAVPGPDTASGDYRLSATPMLTIAAGATASTGTVTITAVDNDVDAANKSVTVSGAVSGGGDKISNPTDVTLAITDDDTRGITVSPPTLTVDEQDDGSTPGTTENEGTYTVVLTSEPTGTVTVSAASGAEGVATVSPSSLEFDAGDWETKQTVTVTGIDDAVDNTMNKRTTRITHTVSASGTDYQGETASSVSVEVTDDDVTPGGITLSANPASVGEEDGATAVTVTATVNGATRYAGATEVVVSVADGTAVSPGDYASVSGFTITIAAGAASASGSFTLTPVDDSLDEDNETINVTGASGTLTVSGTAVTITDDDDTPAVSLSLTPATIGESGATNASTVTASLDGASSWAVTVTVSAAPGPDTASGDYRLSATPMLTIAAGATASTGTVTITAVDNDVDAANKSVTVSGAVSGGGDKISNPTDVTLAITDDDTRGITVSPPTLTVDEQDDGGTPATENEGTYTVVLTSEPTGTVTVSAASGAEGVATVSPSSLEFDAGDWETKQTVTVTGIDDAVDNTMNKRTTRITHTVSASGTDYQGETASSVSVEVTDDDVTPGGITLSANPASVGEEDGATAVTVTATVNGATRYAGATEVVVSVADGTAVSPGDYASVSGFTITIAAGAASASGSFTLTPVDDSLDEDNETINVTGASGTLTVSGTAVTITDDDDTPAVSLSLTPATIGESGATNASTVTASLDGASSWAVTVTVSAAPGPDTASGDYRLSATPMLTIAAGATASTGTVTITAVDNDVDAANKSVTVSGAVSGGGDKISNPTDVTLAITDDDTRGITVSPPTLTVDEQDDGSTPGTTENEGTYTVVLTSEPTGTVTVSAASGAEGVATVSPSSLEFDAGDWETKQTVTVTGIDDAVDNTMNKRTTRITHTVSASGTDYQGETASSVSVEVTDDDVTPGGITLSANPASVGEEDGATAVTVTATVNGATRYAGATEVVVSVADGTAVSPGDYASVSGFTITIAAGAASASGSFTLTPVDDSLDEDNETINVTGASGTLTVSGTAVTITDDDDTPGGITLSANPASVGEGAGATAVTVTATVNGTARYADATEVVVSVGGGTAISGTDYTAVSDFTITIAGGGASASGSFTLTPVDDSLDEVNETIDVTGTSGALTVTGTAVTITDNDATPTVSLSLDPQTIDESGATNVSTVTASLNRASSRAITVTVSASPGNRAVAGDYTLSANKTLTIAAGTRSSTGTVTITAVDNQAASANKSVTVSGTASGGGVSNPADVTLTIRDDEGRSLVLNPRTVTVPEGGSAGYTVKLATEPTASVTVAITGQAQTDLTLSGTSLTFTASTWNVAQTVTVNAGHDTDSANDTATLTHTASGGDYGSVTGTVAVNTTDDDTVPTAMTLAVDTNLNQAGAQASVSERAGNTTVRVTATITGTNRFTTDQVVAVYVGQSGDSAAEGTDYTTVGTLNLTIRASQASGHVDFTLTPTDDEVDEPNETIGITGMLSGITVAPTAMTLEDNDDLPTVTLVLTPASIDEGGGATRGTSRVTASLNRPTTAAVTLTVSASAVAPATSGDYTLSANKILTIAAGETASTGTVTVTAVDNALDTPDRQVHISATAAGGHGVADPGLRSLTIVDDDETPTELTLTVDTDTATSGLQDTVGEGAGATPVRVTATLVGAGRFTTAQTVTVTVGDPGDSAIEGTDYATVADLSLTIPAGQASGSKDFPLTPTDDGFDEPNETLSVDGMLAGVAVTPTAITLEDDDVRSVVTLVLSPTSIDENGGEDSGTSTVTAVLDRPTGAAVVLTVSAVPVSPTAPTDFTQTGNALTVAAGSRASTGIVTLAAVDNVFDAPDKQVIVSATVSGGYGVAAPTPVGLTLVDDDAAPTSLILSVDTELEEDGLQNIIAEDTGGMVRVTATLEGPTRFAAEKTVTIMVGKPGDGATEGRDYEEVEDLAIVIPAGQASGSTDFELVPIEDGISEPKETISVDGVLTGVTVTPTKIILQNNGDPLLKAWIARFGRTVAEQVMDSVGNRMDRMRMPGFEVRVAGSKLSRAEREQSEETAWDRQQARMDRHRTQGFDAAHGDGSARWEQESRTLTGRDILLESSFSYTGEERGGVTASLWGRAARSGFDGREGKYDLDGEVTTGMLGADWMGERWSGGFVFSRSQGQGSYDKAEGPQGSIDPALTAFSPWVSFQANERLTLWGIAGYGEGDITIRPEAGPPVSTDLDWLMTAVGAEGDLVALDGLALKLKADGLWVRTRSDQQPGLKKADTDVTRMRVGLEGSRAIYLSGAGPEQTDAGTLTPKLEIGVRYDEGDAEAGFGAEVGGGITWVAPNLGLDFSAEGRSLVLHEDGSFRDWGFAASLTYDQTPESARGISWSLSHELGGSPSGGVEDLFVDGAPASAEEASAEGTWQAEVAYGTTLPGGRFVGGPRLGYAESAGSREYSIGLQAALPRAASGLSFDLMAIRREDDSAEAEHAFGFEVRSSW